MKLKKLILLFFFIVVGLISVLLFWPKKKPLDPQAFFKPDLSSKLEKKIIPPLNLDFSLGKEIKNLTTIPRYLVFNLDTAKVYAAKNWQEKIAPASFTKLLTGEVALDFGFPEELLTATSFSVNKVPSILGLRAGEQLSLSDLLRASIATSGNDAAATMAEGVAVQNGLAFTDFIDSMNKKADLLGMKNSHFANPEGLDDQNQYSTLADLAQLVTNTVKNYPEIIAAAASDRQDIQKSAIHDFYYLSNWNGLLGVYPGVFGLKIAYTENAGYSTIVTAERSGVRLAAILTGADSLIKRDTAAASLLDAGFAAEKIAPANISQAAIKRRHKVWEDLIKKTRTASLAQN